MDTLLRLGDGIHLQGHRRLREQSAVNSGPGLDGDLEPFDRDQVLARFRNYRWIA